MAAAAVAWDLIFSQSIKMALLQDFSPTLLFVEMYHSLNIRAVLSNLKALLFAGNTMFC